MKENNNTNRLAQGLHTDNSPIDQKKGTYRYAKNAVLEGREGDVGFIGNELGNEVCALFPLGYIPIGKVYMSDGQVAIFLTNAEETVSEIGVLYDNCKYESVVNSIDLGFKIKNQIDATYRLRRGCERVIYFTDGLNKPRIFNFENTQDFKDTLGNWDESKFNLFKTYNSIPRFMDISVEETGQLPAGSYNFAIQYLDEDFNPTEWIATTDTVIIYEDNGSSKAYKDVRGSTNKVTAYQDYGNTNKSIKLTLTNLDTDFVYYRIAIIEANNGSGDISKVLFSGEISTEVKSYTYTGTNAQTEGSVVEIQQFNNIIESASHIEQIENRLILSGTKGKQLNFCKLQKYASRIKADLVTQEVVLNNLDFQDNPKRTVKHLEKVGYMPGEIYSFGIVWVFQDGTTSPVYHIPGRSSTYSSDMDSNNNLENTFYIDNNSCAGEKYWGYDSQGVSLENAPVRHHRFPSRGAMNKPVIMKNGTATDLIQNIFYLDITGTISDPPVSEPTMQYIVDYTIDGIPFQKTLTLDTVAYDETTGEIGVFVDTSTGDFLLVNVSEIPDGGGPAVPPAANSTLTYTARTEMEIVELDDAVYTAEIFGINFSNIDVPEPQDLNGETVVGYYIVRNERTDDEKTILDTGVLTPMIEETRDGVSKFVAFGQIAPRDAELKEDIVALVHPEHKFKRKEHTGTTRLVQEGVYSISLRSEGSHITQDVQPGTSYDSSVNKRRERDSDGFDLHNAYRNSNVDFIVDDEVLAEQADIKDIFYLDSLFSKGVTDINAERKEVFNLSGDNRTGVVQLNKSLNTTDLETNFPYVVMQRDLSDPYGNFRVLSYYKEHTNMQIASTPTNNSITLFNGDVYISSMRYLSSTFYDLRIKDRDRKTGALNFIIGVLGVLIGSLLIATGVGAAIGIAVIGLGVSQLSTGFKKSQAAKVYADLYEQGLQDTVGDGLTDEFFADDPADDEIQWTTDVVTNLWFESTVNMNWRQGNTIGLTDFLAAPGVSDIGEIRTYAIEKVTNVDPQADGGRNYQGYCKAEIYEVNADYFRREREKVFFHLALEYDCCSECLEEFPHRTFYSEQSFQEEITDHYRTFLPNNYRDIEGGTGPITNVFRIQNNLYLHTEEALWHLPQNIQERVTGDIISFIGTGSFFSIPPRKIIDDAAGNSAGTQHKWGMIKTPHGVFFISENQNTIYKFNGNKLEPISKLGEYSWFKENITVGQDKTYYDDNTKQYPYRDNPSNKFGTGYVLTYDSKLERILVTKKDFELVDAQLDGGDYELCVKDGQLIAHLNYSQIIADEAADGWTLSEMNEDCELCFEKVTEVVTEVEVETTIPNTADIHIFYDTSGSFGYPGDRCLDNIDTAVDDWIANFGASNPDWVGSVYKYEDATERWINYPQIIASTTYAGEDLSTKDIIVVSFCNEAEPVYHGGPPSTPIDAPTTTYLQDFNNFKVLHGMYNSFIGVAYPIVFGANSGVCVGTGTADQNLQDFSKHFLQHSIAATFGTTMTPAEVASELGTQNPGFTTLEWETMKTNLQTLNPYPDDGLRDYGWRGKWDRAASPTGEVIDSAQFQADMEEILAGMTSTETIEVVVSTIETKCIPGTVLDPTIYDCSWTKSFNIKFNAWVAFHDYRPNFYINTPDKYYSWVEGNDNLWKHNAKDLYQNYYGVLHDFVVEYVSLSSPLQSRVWNNIKLITEAQTFSSEHNSYRDLRNITFNEIMVYNSRQNSGLLTMKVKDSSQFSPEDYISHQVANNIGEIIIDRNERDWTINDFRDMVGNYLTPMFLKDKFSLQGITYSDKILNPAAMDQFKDWSQQEVFRDKYLIIRLLFNNFDTIKLLLNYSVENEIPSER